MKKEPKFQFYVKDQAGNPIDIDTLTPEERREIGIWAYRTILKELGYAPADKNRFP